ncbi:hypothetical protein [Azospirillum doebereinerae]
MIGPPLPDGGDEIGQQPIDVDERIGVFGTIVVLIIPLDARIVESHNPLPLDDVNEPVLEPCVVSGTDSGTRQTTISTKSRFPKNSAEAEDLRGDFQAWSTGDFLFWSTA